MNSGSERKFKSGVTFYEFIKFVFVVPALVALVTLVNSCGSGSTTGPAGGTFAVRGVSTREDIGVFYFPGWNTGSKNWKDLLGTPDSTSPGVAWPDREPLLGFGYPEEATWVAEQEIDWAASNGITFFAYDWYWFDDTVHFDHAVKAFLRAQNRARMRFCLLWANHFDAPKTLQEFDDMVSFWINVYFKEPNYYQIDGRPVVFIFSLYWLGIQSSNTGLAIKAMLTRADETARSAGYPGIYFILTTDEQPGNGLEASLVDYGFSAYTGWNYARAEDTSLVADYDSMVSTYRDFYNAAGKTAKNLPYLVPASPGRDDRPWLGNSATVRLDPTPDKFETMLRGAKALMDTQQTGPKLLMIESWNEWAEGSSIAPTKKWGTTYLGTIRKIFGAPAASNGK